MNSVLIIDDDKELCTLMKKCVEQENLSAVVAYEGLEGLRLMEENKDTCPLIILDVMMPDMNGFQVLQNILVSLQRLCVICALLIMVYGSGFNGLYHTGAFHSKRTEK